MKKDTNEKRKELFNNIKKWGFIILIVIILIRINKDFFFLGLFTLLAFAGKIVRGQFGLKMVVLDPLMFCCILIVKFLGIKELLIYLFINIFVADMVSGIFSPGSFINYVLYHVCPIVGVLLFGNFNMLIYGSVTALLYSVLYGIARTIILPDDPVQVVSKSITSFVFTFLYITFFGPLFQLLMSA